MNRMHHHRHDRAPRSLYKRSTNTQSSILDHKNSGPKISSKFMGPGRCMPPACAPPGPSSGAWVAIRRVVQLYRGHGGGSQSLERGRSRPSATAHSRAPKTGGRAGGIVASCGRVGCVDRCNGNPGCHSPRYIPKRGGGVKNVRHSESKFGAENIWHQFLKCHCDNLVPILRLRHKNKRRPGTVGAISYGPLVGCSDFPEALGHSGTAHAKRANSDTQKNGSGPSNAAA